MQNLNLPVFDYKIKKFKSDKYKIYDIIRKKYIILTPEEWVRQHMIHYLTKLGYPKALISVESSLYYHDKKKRSDIIVYTKKGEITILIECKASYICLNEKTLNQISLYNKIIKANYIVITNGIIIFCFELEKDRNKNNGYKFINSIPKFK